MALSGNCGYGALARLGGGDLRAFVMVLVMGLSAYVVMSGPLAPARVWLFPAEDGALSPQGLSQLAISNGISPLLTGLAVGSLILGLSALSRPMLRAPGHLVWGTVVGLAVVSGWVGTY